MKRKPSILFLNRVFPGQKGATGRVLLDLSHAFVKDGWQVSIVTTGSEFKVPTSLKRKAAFNLYRVGKTPKKTVLGYAKAYFQLMFKALGLPKHAIVVTMTDPPMLVTAGRFISFMKASKHMHWCHDLYPDLLPVLGVKWPKWTIKLLRRFSVNAMNKSDRVIAIGRCMARYLNKRGVEAKKISVIPNWYDVRILDKNAAQKSKRKKKVAIKTVAKELAFTEESTKFRILYAGSLGRLHPIKPILLAAQKLQKTHSDIEFVFVGDGVGFKNLARERSERGLTNIRLLPHQPIENLPALMESGDVHLVTLNEKATGLSVPSKFYGSLATGRPVIFLGPPESEVAKIISDFGCGSVIDPDNINALSLAIQNYRESDTFWFNAQKASIKAAKILTPEQSMQLWLDKAENVFQQL